MGARVEDLVTATTTSSTGHDCRAQPAGSGQSRWRGVPCLCTIVWCRSEFPIPKSPIFGPFLASASSLAASSAVLWLLFFGNRTEEEAFEPLSYCPAEPSSMLTAAAPRPRWMRVVWPRSKRVSPGLRSEIGPRVRVATVVLQLFLYGSPVRPRRSAITVVTVMLRALDRVRQRVLGLLCFGLSCRSISPPWPFF